MYFALPDVKKILKVHVAITVVVLQVHLNLLKLNYVLQI